VRGVPLALWRGSRFTSGKTAVASGVVAYKIEAAEALPGLSVLKTALVIASEQQTLKQTQCQSIFRTIISLGFLHSLAASPADLSECSVGYVD
jgi:hypothetical protein